MNRKQELLALADRIRARDADMKLRGGKIQRVFRDEMPMVIEALESAAADDAPLKGRHSDG